MSASRAAILQLLDSLEPKVRAAYLRSIDKITSRISISAVTAAVEAGDLSALLQAVEQSPASWADLTEQIRDSYKESGQFTVNADVPKRFGLDFDINNPRAEKWIRNHSSSLITLINNEQREAIQDVLEASLQVGRNPRSTALDIVGRINRATKRREGGIVGLNVPQANAVISMRHDLNSNLGVGVRRIDPVTGKPVKSFWIGRDGDLKSEFTRRDRRFDSVIKKAIDSDKPLSQTDIDRITGRYSDRLLKLRGDTIGRTESLQALNEASDESLRQVVDEGLAPPDAVTRIWDSAGDTRTRPAHVAMDNSKRGVDEPFESGTGALLMHPGDSSLGAGADDIINCRCIVSHSISFIEIENAA